MNEEKEMMELTEVEDNYEPEEEYEGSGVFKKVAIGVGGAVAAGAVALAVKKRDKIKAKIEEHKIAKLEKKGYVVYRPEEVEVVEEVDENEPEEEK